MKQAIDLLEKRGGIYSSRPRNIMAYVVSRDFDERFFIVHIRGEILSGNMRGLDMPYGPRWRNWRSVSPSLCQWHVDQLPPGNWLFCYIAHADWDEYGSLPNVQGLTKHRIQHSSSGSTWRTGSVQVRWPLSSVRTIWIPCSHPLIAFT